MVTTYCAITPYCKNSNGAGHVTPHTTVLENEKRLEHMTLTLEN